MMPKAYRYLFDALRREPGADRILPPGKVTTVRAN